MNPEGRNESIAAPFEVTVEGRREYLLRRVSGVPVPPPPAVDRGEEPCDLLAAWMLHSSVPWADDLRQDLRLLLKESLAAAGKSASDQDRWRLGGLLTLAIRVRDADCGEAVGRFMQGPSPSELSSSFLALQDTDGLYDRLGTLMFRLLDVVPPAPAAELLVAGVQAATNPSDAAERLTYLARRDTKRAQESAATVIGLCQDAGDIRTAEYVVRILREACWQQNEVAAAMGLRDLFSSCDRAVREFAADALARLGGYLTQLFARQLRHARRSCSPDLIERKEAGLACRWLALAA